MIASNGIEVSIVKVRILLCPVVIKSLVDLLVKLVL